MSPQEASPPRADHGTTGVTGIWLQTAFVLSLLLMGFTVIIHLSFWHLPLFFLALGAISWWRAPRRAMALFLFLLPAINATPALFWNGYPFNYMAVSLFYLSGMGLVMMFREGLPPVRPKFFRYYGYFLAIVFLSAFFLFIRWSNVTLPGRAFLANTPVEPEGSKLAFAVIFPALTLALFAISPLVFLLIRQVKFGQKKVFHWLGAGYLVSFAIAVVQLFIDGTFLTQGRWLTKGIPQVNGGGSHFNAFGLFSGLIFLYFACRLMRRFSLYPLVVTLAALMGIFLSGCRSAFLAIPLWMVLVLADKRINTRIKFLGIGILILLIAGAGGSLRQRLSGSLIKFTRLMVRENKVDLLDELSTGRVTLFKKSYRMVAAHSISGVGSGNFLFYLKRLNRSGPALEDLPLNHYLLILAENGLFGLAAFVGFLISLFAFCRRPFNRNFMVLLGFLLFVLLLNNFLWLPEIIIFFWILPSLQTYRETVAARYRGKGPVFVGLLLMGLLVGFHLANQHELHPKVWARGAETRYDYGFWYPEKDPVGITFRWTRSRAGIYIYLNDQGESEQYRLFCGAPLARLPGRRQTVDIYWRGKLYRQVAFTENRGEYFRITDPDHREGFLEFRVHSTFNLEEMGLSPESRDLGIQFSGTESDED